MNILRNGISCLCSGLQCCQTFLLHIMVAAYLFLINKSVENTINSLVARIEVISTCLFIFMSVDWYDYSISLISYLLLPSLCQNCQLIQQKIL